MDDPLSRRRLIENEVASRRRNERIQQGFNELARTAKEDNQAVIMDEEEMPLHFYCECADKNCRQRIRIPRTRYNEIHQQRNHFVIVCGHETDIIEHIVGKEEGFCIVEKAM